MKNFIPVTTTATTYTLPFNDALLGQGETISSSKFTFDGRTNSYLDDDGVGNVRVYYIDASGSRVYTNRTAGTVDYTSGLVTLPQILITGFVGTELQVYAVPSRDNVTSVRNQILAITQAKITLFDTNLKRITSSTSNVSTQGSSATVVGSGVISTVF